MEILVFFKRMSLVPVTALAQGYGGATLTATVDVGDILALYMYGNDSVPPTSISGVTQLSTAYDGSVTLGQRCVVYKATSTSVSIVTPNVSTLFKMAHSVSSRGTIKIVV